MYSPLSTTSTGLSAGVHASPNRRLELEAEDIAHESLTVVGVGEEGHSACFFFCAHEGGFRVELQAIGLFVEAGPGVVAAAADLQHGGLGGTAYGLNALGAAGGRGSRCP